MAWIIWRQLHADGAHPLGRVERKTDTPERPMMASRRNSGWWSMYLDTTRFAIRPAVAMPLPMTAAGTGAWMSVWHLAQAHWPSTCHSTAKLPDR